MVVEAKGEGSSLFSLAIDEQVVLTTVGIDIGSSTSQLGFSQLCLQNVDSRWIVTGRTILHESEVVLTPFLDTSTIDVRALKTFIDGEYRAASMTNEQIDSGAIILTGLALAKENARKIAELFAHEAGKFVAVSAGDALEATLASRGAGLERLSREGSYSIVHIDMGGGTTKFAHWVDGRLVRVAAIDVGARLIRITEEGVVSCIEPAAVMMLEDLRADVAVGDALSDDQVANIANYGARQVLAHAGVLSMEVADQRLLRTARLFDEDVRSEIDFVTFSGGVSEYIYRREARRFGDLGAALGEAIRHCLESETIEFREPRNGIRATVLGAAQYGLQMSGSTVWASSPELVPLRNVAVVKPELHLDTDELDYAQLSAALQRALEDRATTVSGDLFAVAIRWQGSATFARIDTLARALLDVTEREGLEECDAPLVVVCDVDIAGLLGRHLQDLRARGVAAICLDGIEVSDFDFLDIGAFVPGTGALPVVVKTLLFPAGEADGCQVGRPVGSRRNREVG